jgi:hypothetical protein
MTVHRVIIFIRQPSPGDPGQVSDGYYVLNAGELVMTHSDGEPVSPDQFRHTLKPGDDPAAIAGVLTRRCRRFLLGISEAEEAFNRPLGYSNAGIV